MARGSLRCLLLVAPICESWSHPGSAPGSMSSHGMRHPVPDVSRTRGSIDSGGGGVTVPRGCNLERWDWHFTTLLFSAAAAATAARAVGGSGGSRSASSLLFHHLISNAFLFFLSQTPLGRIHCGLRSSYVSSWVGALFCLLTDQWRGETCNFFHLFFFSVPSFKPRVKDFCVAVVCLVLRFHQRTVSLLLHRLFALFSGSLSSNFNSEQQTNSSLMR